jgi:hypothetical protein
MKKVALAGVFLIFGIAGALVFTNNGIDTPGEPISRDSSSEKEFEKEFEEELEKDYLPDESEPELSWRKTMYTLGTKLPQILRDTTRSSDLNRLEEEKKIIQSHIKDLSDLAHQVSEEQLKSDGAAAHDYDPTLFHLSNLFEREMNRASLVLESGDIHYAKDILRASTQFCISCHTRGNVDIFRDHFEGPDFLRTLHPQQRFEYFVATLQFEQAFEQYQELVEDPSFAKESSLEWEKTLRGALNISVRVFNDPKQTLDILSKASENERATKALKLTIQDWRNAALRWEAEDQTVTMTHKEHLEKAQGLVGAAQREQEYILDPAAEIDFLRASYHLHRFLKAQNVSSQQRAEALLLLGICYEVLPDPSMSMLHEFYYESCIRAQPKSPLAQTCYQYLSDTVTAGYSGSSGVNIPLNIQNQLEDLRKLATPN